MFRRNISAISNIKYRGFMFDSKLLIKVDVITGTKAVVREENVRNNITINMYFLYGEK